MNNESRELLFDITRSVFVIFFVFGLAMTFLCLPFSLIFLDAELLYIALRSLAVMIVSAVAIFLMDTIK